MGLLTGSPISNSYAVVEGDISSFSASVSRAGGLIGNTRSSSSISNSYAIVTGDISSSAPYPHAGGLVGRAADDSPVSNSYYSARRKAGEGTFSNTEGAPKTVAKLKAPTGLSGIYAKLERIL